jgi:hypothetical protein
MTVQGLKIDEGYSAAPQQPREMQPFDPLTQVSADAKYIVKSLVLWFFVLPLLLGLLACAIYALTR